MFSSNSFQENKKIVQKIIQEKSCELNICSDCPISTLNWLGEPKRCYDFSNEGDGKEGKIFKAKAWLYHYSIQNMLETLL